MPTRCNRWFFTAKLIVCSTCFGQHYAHHQELKSIIQVVVACGTWCYKDVIFKLDSIRVFWVLSIVCCTGLLWACQVSWGFCGYLRWVAGEFWMVCVCGSGIPFVGWVLNARMWERWIGACARRKMYIPLIFKLSVWRGHAQNKPVQHTILNIQKTRILSDLKITSSQHQVPQAATTCIILLSSWWWV
jgi:hypothetical protein